MSDASEQHDLVRREVGRMLGASPAWSALDPKSKRSFARNMESVARFLAQDPAALDKKASVARALEGPVEDTQKRLAQAPGQVGQDFKAGAMREGVEGFKNLVNAVDFPQFVGGLIQGVFQAIVDASIQQMEAFGELLAATAKSVDQFARDHIGDDQAREQIAARYPSLVSVQRTEEGTRLMPKEDADDPSALTALTKGADLSDPEAELRIVQATKLEMAQQRQKMMALMVMLGINRIVVTNGRINARVLFDIATKDVSGRHASAGMSDETASEAGAAAATWQPWGAAAAYAKTSHRTLVQSSIDDTSESKAQMKAQLAGDVRVNFKSETLAPEKMLDAMQFQHMSALSQPGVPPVAPPAPGTAPAAAPTTSPAPAATPANTAARPGVTR